MAPEIYEPVLSSLNKMSNADYGRPKVQDRKWAVVGNTWSRVDYQMEEMQQLIKRLKALMTPMEGCKCDVFSEGLVFVYVLRGGKRLGLWKRIQSNNSPDRIAKSRTKY